MRPSISAMRGEALQATIQEYIKDYIIRHGLKHGDPLPSEGAIASHLAASRNAVREAVKSLQTLGIVETRHGQGTFVGAFSFSALVTGLTFRIQLSANRDLSIVRELLEIRQVLECGLVARLPDLITESQLAELHILVNKMEAQAAQGKTFPEEDRAFHEVLYRPLDNSLVIQLLQAFWEIYHIVEPQLLVAPEYPGDTAASHRRILEALEALDGNKTVAAMEAHFAAIQSRIADFPSPRPGKPTSLASDQAITHQGDNGPQDQIDGSEKHQPS
ncbi:MAG: FadR family transcriptional regulator [Ktedonobacteraceae bacterium]|nr:FadR family transcriptional regulator [Ktedonobacteraceae bacterium]